MLKCYDEGEQFVLEQGIYKGCVLVNVISIGVEQVGIDKKFQKSCGCKCGLVGYIEYVLLVGVEDVISNEIGVDVVCLKQIVKFKKIVKGQ